jgi:hypothetical protein
VSEQILDGFGIPYPIIIEFTLTEVEEGVGEIVIVT